MSLSKEIVKVEKIRNDIENFSNQYRDTLYEIFAKSQDRTLSASIIQTLRAAQEEFPGLPIIQYDLIRDAVKNHHQSPFLYILDIFGIEGEGTFVTGYLCNGGFEELDSLTLQKADGRNLPTMCKAILDHPSLVYRVLVDGLHTGEISQGDCLLKV